MCDRTADRVSRRSSHALSGIVVICLLSVHALGQGEITGAIQGKASDSTGAKVSGAPVTITSLDIGSKCSAETDEAGRVQLEPGSYKVEIHAQGFEPPRRTMSSQGRSKCSGRLRPYDTVHGKTCGVRGVRRITFLKNS